MPSRTARVEEFRCRMTGEEIALLDEVAEHFGEDGRSSMFRAMLRQFRTKMLRDLQRGIGPASPHCSAGNGHFVRGKGRAGDSTTNLSRDEDPD
jgi:hypothetical protein